MDDKPYIKNLVSSTVDETIKNLFSEQYWPNFTLNSGI